MTKKPAFTKPKRPNPTDRHVGMRIRMRRLMLKMTQETLADGLGVTFQQVQKYESGTNRVGASRLQQIAQILKVPVSFFFEGGPQSGELIGDHKIQKIPDYVSEFLATSEGLQLTTALSKIKDPKVLRTILELLVSVSK